MIDFELKEPLDLASIGDSFINLIYSLAISNALNKPLGITVSNSILYQSIKKTKIRDAIGTRSDKHKIADYVEGYIFKAWAEGKLDIKEAVDILARCLSGSTDRLKLKEESIIAFTELLLFIQDKKSYDLKRPLITVDCIVEKGGKILLIKRKNHPFSDQWALPGGFVEYGEKVMDAVKREVKEETNIDTEVEEILDVYSNPKRDPRGHTISICYIGKGKGMAFGDSDASDAKFFELSDINYDKLAFDHKKIIRDYSRLKNV